MSKLIYRDGISFDDWMKAIDQLLIKKIGLTHEDLPDYIYADLFEDRLNPATVVAEILEQNGFTQ